MRAQSLTDATAKENAPPTSNEDSEPPKPQRRRKKARTKQTAATGEIEAQVDDPYSLAGSHTQLDYSTVEDSVLRGSSTTSAIRRAKIGFQPIETIQSLPEYAAAGLKESDTSKYLPSLSINTVEEFLGLIRGVPKELAQDLGTTEDKLVDLYNAAMASQLPAMSSETIEDLLKEEYSFGLSLEAPPEQSETASLAVSPDIEMDVSASASLAAPVALEEETISLIDENMPPIRDQGKRGTCVAFSTCAVMEYMTSSAGKPAQHLSVQYLYWIAKGLDGYPKDGTWLTFSFPVAREQGTCKETLWPYVRNSWGGRWGRESPFGPGYGYISYEYIRRFNVDAWTGVV